MAMIVAMRTDYPYGNSKAGRQFFDQMPISAADKQKIAQTNAERLIGSAIGPLQR